MLPADMGNGRDPAPPSNTGPTTVSVPAHVPGSACALSWRMSRYCGPLDVVSPGFSNIPEGVGLPNPTTPLPLGASSHVGSAVAQRLVLEISCMNSETVTSAAVRHALSAQLGVSKEITPSIPHQRFEYLWCYVAV